MFWVISVYFNIRNTLPKSGTFLLGHPVCIYVKVNKKCKSSHRWIRNLFSVISISYRLKAHQISSVFFHFLCHPRLSFELLHSFKYRVLELIAETVCSLSDFPKHYFLFMRLFNPLNPELNPICYLLALLGAHHFLHVSRIRVKLLTFRRLMSCIYGAPILDVSRSHTTTQHSR